MTDQIRSAEILSAYPAVDIQCIRELLLAELQDFPAKIIVLDDDPTGVQTVHDIYVYTDWTVESLTRGLHSPERLFYVLTNSRGLTKAETEKAHREIAENLICASRAADVPFVLISRSDSTLRGHYPLETEVLKDCLEESGLHVDGEILCPYFKEGGRFTVDDVHYVQYGSELVPAAMTEFAKDRTFGYTKSDLKEYVEEKTGGAYPADTVVSISLAELRGRKYEAITDKLLQVKDFRKVIVNAAGPEDVMIFSVAVLRAMKQGKRFLFRTAAGLVQAIGGIESRELLTKEEMIRSEGADLSRTENKKTGERRERGHVNGGLVVVGSHTQKTTEQLQELLQAEGVVPVEFNSDLVMEGEDRFAEEIARCVAEEERIMREGRTAVCYTSRKLLSFADDTPEIALQRSVRISEGVQRLVKDIHEIPAFIVAKGGITSSTIGTEALGVKRALVLGQIEPGIPVWQTDPGSKFPEIPYVIFPGNVGDRYTLRRAVEKLL